MQPLWESGDEQRMQVATSIGARAHCALGRVVPVLAAASSGVGECQGGVNGVETMMVASFG